MGFSGCKNSKELVILSSHALLSAPLFLILCLICHKAVVAYENAKKQAMVRLKLSTSISRKSTSKSLFECSCFSGESIDTQLHKKMTSWYLVLTCCFCSLSAIFLWILSRIMYAIAQRDIGRLYFLCLLLLFDIVVFVSGCSLFIYRLHHAFNGTIYEVSMRTIYFFILTTIVALIFGIGWFICYTFRPFSSARENNLAARICTLMAFLCLFILLPSIVYQFAGRLIELARDSHRHSGGGVSSAGGSDAAGAGVVYTGSTLDDGNGAAGEYLTTTTSASLSESSGAAGAADSAGSGAGAGAGADAGSGSLARAMERPGFSNISSTGGGGHSNTLTLTLTAQSGNASATATATMTTTATTTSASDGMYKL